MNTSKNDLECQTSVYFSVYVLWCSKTNMHYVGVTGQNVYKRIRQHKKDKQQFVDKQIREIGWDGNWDWWIVEEDVPSNLITEREQYWVAFFQAVYPNGYNKTRGGIKHFKHSEETCERMSASHTGKKLAPFTDEHRANISKSRTGEKNPNYGKPAHNRGIPCPEEVKDKIRKKLTGRKRPDQSERMKGENNPNFGKPMPEKTKNKIREKALARDMSGENNPHYGKKYTDEVKAAQSARMKGENNPMYGKSPANKGVPHTDEEKAKMSAAQTGEKNPFFGKHHTEEAKERNRQAHLGKPLSEEHKAKLRGRKHTEEELAKMREKALAREAAKRAAKAAAEEAAKATTDETAKTATEEAAKVAQETQETP